MQNVLLKDLSGDGQAVLIDFETSKDMSIQQTATMTQMHGGAVGTPAYMAPERIAGLPGTADTDRYSIGVVLLLAFCPDLIEDVEGGTLPPLDALDKVEEDLFGWLVPKLRNLLADPLAEQEPAGTGSPLRGSLRPLPKIRDGWTRPTAREMLDLDFFSSSSSSALPFHWEQRADGQRARPVLLNEGDPTLGVLREMVAETRPAELGKGRDEGGEWNRLGLSEGNRHIEVSRAWRLENASLWKTYQDRVQRVNAELSHGPPRDALPAAKHSDPFREGLREGGANLPGDLREECAECFLMTGVPLKSVAGVLTNGINTGFAGQNSGAILSAGLFGAGVYFGEDIEKCDQCESLPLPCPALFCSVPVVFSSVQALTLFVSWLLLLLLGLHQTHALQLSAKHDLRYIRRCTSSCTVPMR